MPDKLQLMETSLERAAEVVGDITGPVMVRFYAAFPEALAAFEHHGLGKRESLEAQMVENALTFAMTWLERKTEVRIILAGSVPHHQDTLAIPPGWYRGLIDAALDVIVGSIPLDQPAERAVWDEIRDGLAREIEASVAAPARAA